MSTPKFVLSLFECCDTSLVGGKAANLGRLAQAGRPVPDGFVVSTLAYRHAKATGGLSGDLSEEILGAYRKLGSPMVAVRSSATAEDMASASMAGQYETFLNIQGEQAVLDAVGRCWASIDAPRVQTYLREHAIDPSEVAMAVIVQRQVPAQVAGVLFTANPRGGGRREMLVEASWGLGEMVVSGRVQPDVLRLERDTGRVLEATIADKREYLAAGGHDPQPVEEARRRQPCLAGRDVHRLWQLGKHVAEHFGRPMDIEWAICADHLCLLQARPITTLQDDEMCEEVLQKAKEHLKRELAIGRGPWVLHNLAETLPHPTPLTWSVIQGFMAGSGGFGWMYRQAGFEPSPVVCRDGFLDCIAGRIYMDAARAPEMFFERFPFRYDPEQLRANPDASQTPPTVPVGSLLDRSRAGRRLKAVKAKLNALSADLEQEMRRDLFEEIAAYVAKAKTVDLRSLSMDRLLDLWQEYQKQVLDIFGSQLLMPGLIAAMAIGELRAFLQESLWDQDADALTRLISSGGRPDRTLIADAELYEVGKGNRSLQDWLARHGHRAAGEFDLAAPRWREAPDAAREMSRRLAGGDDPLERHARNADEVNRQIVAIRSRLDGEDRRQFDRLVTLTRCYIVLREDSKDLLMLGYDLLRDVALEAGRRLEVGPDVFYMTGEEFVEALRLGYAPHEVIGQRKIAYKAETRVTLPPMIDAAVIGSLGQPPEIKPAAGGHKAYPLSSGESTGPAKIVRNPTEAGDLGRGYILVCPSTDPSWTPLFVNAAGLVLECGGTLSHGAVVAREMGLPAVVLPDATKLFHEDEAIHVDGLRGWVGPAGDLAIEQEKRLAASLQTELVPPPAGRKDRAAARLSRRLAVVWALYIAAFFFLPVRWVHQPTIEALDAALWPIVRTLGRPAVVAIVAVAIAAATLLIQRFATDNRRLREAKRRMAALRKQAEALPRESPRRNALMGWVAQVQHRTLAAAMIPVGILLGPMVMPFVWFHERIDPTTWNAPAGSAVQVVASIDSNWRQPVQIDVPQPVTVDDSTPAARTLPPLRETLERLLAIYRQPRDDPNGPWELKHAPDLGREQAMADLQSYLNAGIPPQGVTWLVRPPKDMNGRFSVRVTAGERPPTSIDIVLGDKYPPATSRVTGPAGSPVRELRVVYPASQQKPVFWQPLASLAARNPALAAIDVGWLWLYILVYLPAIVLIRAVLKVA